MIKGLAVSIDYKSVREKKQAIIFDEKLERHFQNSKTLTKKFMRIGFRCASMQVSRSIVKGEL